MISDNFIRPSMPMIWVEATLSHAQLPAYGSIKAADCDLFAAEETVIAARGVGLVKTGLRMMLPAGYRLKLEPRSGLALKKGINVGAGVIDEDYRNEVGVVLFNHSNQDFVVNVGDRIAQASLERYEQAQFAWGTVAGTDVESNRKGGFGSTGV